MTEDGVYFSWRRLWNFQAPWYAVHYNLIVADAWTKRTARKLLSQAEHSN